MHNVRLHRPVGQRLGRSLHRRLCRSQRRVRLMNDQKKKKRAVKNCEAGQDIHAHRVDGARHLLLHLLLHA
ncbi:MAG: hypothetical protein ACK56I_30350, partial [bacterium]